LHAPSDLVADKAYEVAWISMAEQQEIAPRRLVQQIRGDSLCGPHQHKSYNPSSPSHIRKCFECLKTTFGINLADFPEFGNITQKLIAI